MYENEKKHAYGLFLRKKLTKKQMLAACAVTVICLLIHSRQLLF